MKTVIIREKKGYQFESSRGMWENFEEEKLTGDREKKEEGKVMLFCFN